MAGTTARRGRQRGRIEELPSGSLRASVYAGIDPVAKRRHYLREVVPAGPSARKDAERALRRLASKIDEQEQAKTSVTVEQLLEQHFELLEVEPTTLATYETLARGHIRPLIGKQKVGALQARVFDSFYAELRRCRVHCDRRDSAVPRRRKASRSSVKLTRRPSQPEPRRAGLTWTCASSTTTWPGAEEGSPSPGRRVAREGPDHQDRERTRASHARRVALDSLRASAEREGRQEYRIRVGDVEGISRPGIDQEGQLDLSALDEVLPAVR